MGDGLWAKIRYIRRAFPNFTVIICTLFSRIREKRILGWSGYIVQCYIEKVSKLRIVKGHSQLNIETPVRAFNIGRMRAG